MKIQKSHKALLILSILVLSSFIILNGITTTRAAEISEDIKAGDTIWYTVEEFTPLGELIVPDDPSEGSITGSLVGSQVYVKVLNVQKETVQYYDGSQLKTGLVPTVDISTGGILGNSITLTVPTEEGTLEDVVLPAGAGLPFPVNFGTVTVFNVTDLPESVLPAPLVLNDDYSMHEAVANEAKAALASEGGTLTIVNDAAEFALDLYFENSTTGDFIDIAGSWRKTDGLLQSIEVNVDLEGTAATMKLVLEKKEYKPLKVKVGDEWKLTVNQLGFEYELAGFSAQEQADAAQGLDAALAQMDAVVGKTLFDFTIAEVDGLYYRIEGSTYDAEFDEMVPIDGDVWLVGFGTLNYQVPRLAVSGDMNTDGFLENDYQRMLSGPGFAITEDWAIYKAFDLSIAGVVEGYESLLVDALNAQADVTGTISMSYEGKPINGGYEVTTKNDVDLSGPVDSADPTSPTVNIVEKTNGKMVYDKYGNLKSLEMSGSGSLSLSTGESVSISNARVKLTAEYTSDEPLTDNVGDDGNDAVSGGDDAGPGLDVPGFDLYIALLSILSLGFIFGRKRS